VATRDETKRETLQELARPEPVNAIALADTLDNHFSARTVAAVGVASPALRAALLLGSADFMKR
jgi:hypothetical protein